MAHQDFTITLPVDTALYRGRTSTVLENLSSKPDAWFTRDPEDAKTYGYVDEFITIAPVTGSVISGSQKSLSPFGLHCSPASRSLQL